MTPLAATGQPAMIPEVSRRAAEATVAEIGTGSTMLPTTGCPRLWAGPGPGNDQIAGKWRAGRTTKGDR
jgi:hypothetical protein